MIYSSKEGGVLLKICYKWLKVNFLWERVGAVEQNREPVKNGAAPQH